MTARGHKQTKLRKNYKPLAERVAEVTDLVNQGLTKQQMAARLGVDMKTITGFIRKAGLNVAINRAALPKARRVIEETVTAVGALGRGLELAAGMDVNFTAEEARTLLAELKGALVPMYQLSRSLVQYIKEREIYESDQA